MNLIDLMSVLKDYMLGLSFQEIPFEVGMGAFVGFIGFWVLLQFINKPLSEEERVMYFRKLRKIRNSKLRKIKTKDSKIELKQEIVGVETSDFKYVSERPKSNMKKCKVSLSAGMIQASQQQDWEVHASATFLDQPRGAEVYGCEGPAHRPCHPLLQRRTAHGCRRECCRE